MARFWELLSSADAQERELAFELCTKLVAEPDEFFISEMVDLLGISSPEAKVTILELLQTYEEFLDTDYRSAILALIDDPDDTVRLAAFRFINAINLRPSTISMLDSLGDPVGEIVLIVTELLQDVVLCEKTSFEVAEYLGHDNPQVREAAKEILLSGGQEDLVQKQMGN